MNTLNYLLQTNLYLILFMGFYMLVLRNETFFKQNRIFLNGSVLLSFIIPFINSDWFRQLFITQKVREATIPLQVIYDPVIVQVSEDAPKWTVTEIIMWIYLIGASIFLARFIIQLIWLKYNLKAKRGAAFSFFKALIVDAELQEKETIINHEKVHIRQWHSLDVILIELAAVLNWFNPVAYIYKKEIKHIHEFIADEEAAGLQQSKSDYALLLLSNTLGVNPHQLSNSFFNQSLLKRRILMLGKSRSRRTGLLKYGLSAPLFAAMLIFSAATVKQDKTTLINESKKITSSLISTLTPSEEPDQYKSFLKRNPSVKELAWKIKPYRVTVYLKNGDWESYNMENQKAKSEAKAKYGEFPYPPPPPPVLGKIKQVEIPDASSAEPLQTEADIEKVTQMDVKLLAQFLGRSIYYPVIARKNKVAGWAVVAFTIKNNLRTGAKVIDDKDREYGFGAEALRALSRWHERLNLKDGEYQLSVTFELDNVSNPINSEELKQLADRGELPNYLGNLVIIKAFSDEYDGPLQDDLYDFSSLGQLPEFPGGEKGFRTFLSKNLKYPELAKANKITGRVFISFVVEKDGSLSDLKVIRGLGYGTDEEAIRVLKNSPKWKPGMINNNPVRVKYVLPIQFQLSENSDSKTGLQAEMPAALYFVNGKESQVDDIMKISTASIKTVNVLKGEKAIEKYGKKGNKGVVEITTN